ncbi:MAG: radical SAM protein [Actinoallomurus sp.]
MTTTTATTEFLWLEITGKCQSSCSHCYASSGPDGTTGAMTTPRWKTVITDAAVAGVRRIQFIGGEPTLHPDLAALIRHALEAGMQAEVYTNLVHVTDQQWAAFRQQGVSLATSYYSDDRREHEQITGRDTLRQTTANIERAVQDQIPLRVGIIHVLEDQRVTEAAALLGRLGVTRVGEDRQRLLGRAGAGGVEELCGHCGDGVAAVMPDGGVRPCVMARWMTAGNVTVQPLSEILMGDAMRELVESIPVAAADPCNPDKTGCKPKKDGGDCQPAEKPACNPKHK